jgi:thiol:disulfide interchange protein
MAYLVFGVALGVVVGGWLLFRGKHQRKDLLIVGGMLNVLAMAAGWALMRLQLARVQLLEAMRAKPTGNTRPSGDEQEG